MGLLHLRHAQNDERAIMYARVALVGQAMFIAARAGPRMGDGRVRRTSALLARGCVPASSRRMSSMVLCLDMGLGRRKPREEKGVPSRCSMMPTAPDPTGEPSGVIDDADRVRRLCDATPRCLALPWACSGFSPRTGRPARQSGGACFGDRVKRRQGLARPYIIQFPEPHTRTASAAQGRQARPSEHPAHADARPNNTAQAMQRSATDRATHRRACRFSI